MIRSATMSAALNNMWCGGIHRHCRPASPAAGDRTCSPIAAAGICASRRDPRRRRRYVGAHHRRARRNADRDSDCRERRPVFPGHSASPAWIGWTITAILKTRSVTMQINGARWSMVSIFRSTVERWSPCRRARNGTAVIAILHALTLRFVSLTGLWLFILARSPPMMSRNEPLPTISSEKYLKSTLPFSITATAALCCRN